MPPDSYHNGDLPRRGSPLWEMGPRTFQFLRSLRDGPQPGRKGLRLRASERAGLVRRDEARNWHLTERGRLWVARVEAEVLGEGRGE